ncbi:hypothetical protein [Mariniblastus fucicola]|uniref:TonB C-terminal domain-containing protein n=1 Tax=Mariniblastus fucicola TaxID=980251 RepID=A0A5B9P8H3_9BACT|nr:hypothetical protein [Mariniblastus fucicola]QEG21505.1 hypothetical protein MFFC18_13610 [Mariniblastus fucicola]
MKRMIALSLGCSFLLTPYGVAQETLELPKLATTTVASEVSVPDAGMVRHRTSPQRTSREILASSNIMDQQCSRTEVDGVITYDIIHDNKPLKMVIRPGGAIEMTIVRNFDSRNASDLPAEFREVKARFDAFPTKTVDGSRVRLNLEIETTYSFPDADKLKESRADLYRVYNLHMRPPIVTLSK